MNESNERLMKFLQATPQQQVAIDLILAGQMPMTAPASVGPLLLGMSNAANLIGLSRATLWRMIRAGRLERVEVLPGSFRVRRADIEAIVGGKE